MYKTYVKLFAFCLALLCAGKAAAQTFPHPYPLDSGDYRTTGWDPASALGTYPANMVFHAAKAEASAATIIPVKNWNCAYNLTSKSRFLGLGAQGIGFLNTGSAQPATCSGIATDTIAAYIGAAVLALNTTGRENLSVTWTAGAAALSTGTRICKLQCQYRATPADTFQTVPGSVFEFDPTGRAAGDSIVVTSALPASCNNQPNVQVRWVYYNGGGSGNRTTIFLNNVKATSTVLSGIRASKNTGSFSISPNPSGGNALLAGLGSGYKNITVFDILGNEVARYNTSANEYAVELAQTRPGIYMVQVQGQGGSRSVKRMVVR